MFIDPVEPIHPHDRRSRRRRRLGFLRSPAIAAGLMTLLVLMLVSPLAAQQGSGPAPAVSAGRAARNVAVITIHGSIDEWTALSVEQRIKRAVDDGADAIVFDINTPGGRLKAALDICTAIKSCPISNTVAWINPDAYSAGAIIALACREIVVNDPSSFGDALPVMVLPGLGIEPMPEEEREKILGPLLAEVVDSGRQNGYDEMLVQGLVRRGVELWLIEHIGTGERLFVTADQYELAVGRPPPMPRGPAQVPSVTGGPGSTPLAPPPGSDSTGTAPVSESPTAYQPASTRTSTALAREVDAALEIRGSRTQRPNLRSPEHAGRYREVEYVSDGHGLVLLKADGMLRYGLAAAKVRSDADLKAHFGATSMARLEPSWSIGLVRFLTHPITRGLLIVIFLVSLFIEMTHPGVILPGAVATACFLALVIPPLLVDLAAWWAAGAIVLGIVLIAVELFLIPGFGFFGVVGVIALFGGLIGVFVGGPAGLFPTSTRGRTDLEYGAATVLISTVTSLIVMYFVGKHLPGLPIISRFVLKNAGPGSDAGGDGGDGLLAAMAPAEGPIRPGATGRTLTPLRPAGRVQIGDQIVDVVADLGFIDSGVPVRVVSVDRFRTVVERA